MTDQTTLTNEVKALADKSVGRLLDRPGRWIADDNAPGCWGWQLESQTGDRVALVYYRNDADFEVDDDLIPNG